MMQQILLLSLLVIPSFSMMKNLFQNSKIMEKHGLNIDANLVKDEYIVFFDTDCLRKIDHAAQQLQLEYDCYKLNEKIQDDFPDIVDHWFVMDKTKGCDHDDDKLLDWDEFRIKDRE